MDEYMRTMAESDWSNMCRRSEEHFLSMSQSWIPEVAEMVGGKVKECSSQSAPNTHAERKERWTQSWGLSNLIRAVSAIERTRMQFPRRSEDCLRLVKSVCSLKLPTNDAETSALNNATWDVSSRLRMISADEIALASRR